jgi:hypothetical protein
MPVIYLLGEGLWAETWRKDRKRQPTNGKKSCGPFNGHKIAEVTVLPIKRFALMKSYVIIDAIKAIYIKVKRWRRQMQRLYQESYKKDLLITALGAVTFTKYRMELFI